MCVQHNVRASTRDSTGQNTETKESNLGRSGTDGRNYTDHATATDNILGNMKNSEYIIIYSFVANTQISKNKTVENLLIC